MFSDRRTWDQMEQRKVLCIDDLPHDIQLEILKYVPLKSWPLATDILPSGLAAACIWKQLDLDVVDDICDGIVALLLDNACSIRCMTWNCAAWTSKSNVSLVLHQLLEVEVLNLAFNENIKTFISCII